MLSVQARTAYHEWKSTGNLTTDSAIVEELLNAFTQIEYCAIGIPQYELMWKNAIEEKHRLKDIIDSRKSRIS